MAEPSGTGKLALQALQDSGRWFGDSDIVYSVPFHVLALAGEVGELANLIKKVERGSLDWNSAEVRHNAMMELTDAYVYILLIAGIMGVDLERSYAHVRALNEKRFSAERDARDLKKLNVPQEGIQYHAE